MTKLTRITGKVFGATASPTGSDPTIGPEIGQFGSALAGTYFGTGDVAQIQALPAWGEGFIGAVTPQNQYPTLPEMTGFGKALSYQSTYLLQEGMPEYDENTTYYENSICKGLNNVGKLVFFRSKVDNNTGHPVTDADYWEELSFGGGGATRLAGEIIASTVPLLDAGLHLLDGALLQADLYSGFIDYIAELYNSGDYSNIFTTEANWQSSITSYGVCGKFVYNSGAGTVRLPKITGFIEGAASVSGLGSITAAGLPTHSHTASTDTAGSHAHSRGTMEISGGVTDDGASWNSLGKKDAFYGAVQPVEAKGGYPTNGTYSNNLTSGWTFLASRNWTGVTSYAGSHSHSVTVANATGIYGSSSTVQPQSIKVLYYIVVANTVTSSVPFDLDGLMAVVNAKADKSIETTQNIQTTTGTISLASDKSIYSITPSASTTFTFDTTNLSISSAVGYTFELYVNMSTAQSLTFPASVSWQDGTAPDLSNTGTYFLVFRTIDGGTTWLGNLQGVW